MVSRRISRRDAWRIGLALPGVEESTTYGTPALKVRGTVIACIPSHRSAEPNSLVVRTDGASRAGLLEDAPDIFYLPDHYRNYPFVLVRLGRVTRDALGDLLKEAWRLASVKSPRRRKASA